MISIRLLNNRVIDALKVAFPKGRAAEVALKKYLRLLEEEIEHGFFIPKSQMEARLRRYRISLKTLSQKGPRIGPDKQRLHQWLDENRLQLYSVRALGNNLSQEISTITFNQDVEVDELFATEPDIETIHRTVQKYHPELKKGASLNRAHYHELPVDVHGLRRYVEGLLKSGELTERKRERLRLACDVLALAKRFNGYIYQKLSPSFFGRTYYGGISIQTVPKELRWAILGNCWEYDLKSAAATWKFGFIDAYIAKHHPGNTAEELFPGLIHHLQDKNDWMTQACQETFGVQDVTDDHKKLLKVALQAVGFGARKNSHSWFERRDDGERKRQQSALVEVLGNEVCVDRFLKGKVVSQYLKEHAKLDKFINKTELARNPGIRSLKELQTKTGRVSRSKVMAYLFQQDETKVMDKIRQMIAADGRTVVIANIHDCVITRDCLGNLKGRIEAEIRSVWDNQYWTLGEDSHFCV